jgi:heme-degrading monooxygenase HmoA
VADTAPPATAPLQDLRRDETEVGAAKYATLTEIGPQPGATFGAQADMIPAHLGLSLQAAGLVGHDVWKSINEEGKFALLCAWRDLAAARSWSPGSFAGARQIRHRVVRIVREYGMYDRREAPQYYADVQGGETKHAAPAR